MWVSNPWNPWNLNMIQMLLLNVQFPFHQILGATIYTHNTYLHLLLDPFQLTINSFQLKFSFCPINCTGPPVYEKSTGLLLANEISTSGNVYCQSRYNIFNGKNQWFSLLTWTSLSICSCSASCGSRPPWGSWGSRTTSPCWCWFVALTPGHILRCHLFDHWT